MKIVLKQSWKMYNGNQYVYSHYSECLKCEMEFAIYIPLVDTSSMFASLYYLSGLTCTWENAVTKTNAQKYAAENGLILIFPDTSPRGSTVPNEDDNYACGQGAGFYLNATQSPWEQNYKMYDYIVQELPKVIETNFSQVESSRTGIMGHSMGGHGALTIALKNPKQFQSVSAFSPIVAPTKIKDWGQSIFEKYLGQDQSQWEQYDACQLVLKNGWGKDILIDQGTRDQFLDAQLKPELFAEVCKKMNVDLTLRMQGNYDHSYYFIATFIQDHILWHTERLYL